MQVELIEKIIRLPIAERVEIIERISRSVREDLGESAAERASLIERRAAYQHLRGIAAAEGKTPSTDEEIKEDYADYLTEKYK